MPNVVKKYEHIEELDTYFQEVKKYKRILTRQEEHDLAVRIQAGDETAVDELVKHNLRFVITVAKKFRDNANNVPFSDIISEGNIGLIKAAYKFDPNRNIKFSSYAVWWIKASIRECIANYKTEYYSYDTEMISNMSDKSDMYDNINDDFEKKMNDIQSRQSAVNELVKCLEEREKKIIMLFFGFNEEARAMNLDEISKKMCITKERVRQIKDNALVKMKCEALCSSEYKTYMELR